MGLSAESLEHLNREDDRLRSEEEAALQEALRLDDEQVRLRDEEARLRSRKSEAIARVLRIRKQQRSLKQRGITALQLGTSVEELEALEEAFPLVDPIPGVFDPDPLLPVSEAPGVVVENSSNS